jgi:hypothetical protein
VRRAAGTQRQRIPLRAAGLIQDATAEGAAAAVQPAGEQAAEAGEERRTKPFDAAVSESICSTAASATLRP